VVLRCETVNTGLRIQARKGVQTFADSNRMAFRCRIRLVGDCAETIAVLSIPNGSARDRKLVTKSRHGEVILDFTLVLAPGKRHHSFAAEGAKGKN
jgi:hypothetical protein